MRITNRVVTEKYLKSINNIQTRLDQLNTQVVTGRKYMKVSENTPAAVQGFQIRKDLQRVEGYQSSITYAQGMLSNSESSIDHIQQMLKEAKAQIIYGLNGSQSSEERDIVATQIRNLQQQVLQQLNSNSAGLYYFGGDCVQQDPFFVDQNDGKLHYRYRDGNTLTDIALDDLHSEEQPPGGPDPAYDLYKELMGAGLFTDIGMGIRQDGVTPPQSSRIDRNSVFTYTMPGIQITGVGAHTNAFGQETSLNLYDLLGTIADEFSSGSYTYDRANELFGYLDGWDESADPNSAWYNPKLNDDPANAAYDPTYSPVHTDGRAILTQLAITDVGARMQYLSFMKTRMDTRKLNDIERQQAVEGADPAETIIYYESQSLTYEAALRMGAKVIPMSIFDYIQ
jgi:flagellar hook-associated protein 3 FlgL